MALAAYTAHNLPSGMEPGLKETAFYDPANFTFPAGCYICEVEIDPETGTTEIVQFVAADDFGNIINPMIVEGQVHGGIAQGIGQALLEGAHYDAGGQLLTASYMDYTMPRADDLPSFKVSTSNRRARAIRSASRAAARRAPSDRRRRSSTPSPTPSASPTLPCRHRRPRSGQRSARRRSTEEEQPCIRSITTAPPRSPTPPSWSRAAMPSCCRAA
ncbi:hypothetical protein AJ88_18940 [Mesorhizobium amorphae CCBAU 01583]|nr:hypothetical protein AJ88_18940 [Mesorhizobium amorphae CCBAU 01583]